MRHSFLLFGFLVSFNSLVKAQYELIAEDSIAKLLQQTYKQPSATRNELNFELLSRKVPGLASFDSLRDVILTAAENSRDRTFMCDANRRIGDFYLNYSTHADLFQKSKPYIDRCYEIADESGLDIYKIAALLEYSRFYRGSNQRDKALEKDNQAINLASAIQVDNERLRDSLLFRAYSSLSFTWDLFSNKLSQFQALLRAREFAEKSKIQGQIVSNDNDLGDFYLDTEQYEKCKDYYTLAIQKGKEWKKWGPVIEGMRRISRAYVYQPQKNKELALGWLLQAKTLVDSLQIAPYRLQIQIDLLNYYLNNETSRIAFNYMNTHPEMMKFINDIGLGYQLNKLYAVDCEQRGKFDSAYYFAKVCAGFEYAQQLNFNEKYNFTLLYSRIIKEVKKPEEYRNKLLLAKSFADSSTDLNAQIEVSGMLDSAFQATGDYKNAFLYNNLRNSYKNTLDSLGKQKDLLNVELADANRRSEQQKLEEESKLERRDNLEYMAITIAIASLFILLVFLGVFKMSAAVIRALGFFSFIFLFEFITLLLDKQIHEITHGEPWKVLAIKIILIAMLLPLHHSLEHRAIKYLTQKAHKLKDKLRFFHREELKSDITDTAEES